MIGRATTRKRLTATLLAALVLAAAPGRGRAAQGLTDEEGREARALAVRFVERLREADDFGPPAAHFFPGDFERRLTRFLLDSHGGTAEDSPPWPFDPAMLRRLDEGELLRAYVAVMNFWDQQNLLHEAAWRYVVVEGAAAGRDARQEPGAWARHYELAERAVPAEAFRVAESDPLLEAAFRLVRRPDEGDEGDAPGNPEADRAAFEAAYVRDAARFRALTRKAERCVALMREGVSKLRSEAKSLAAAHNVPEPAADADGPKVYRLDERLLEAPSFGLPAGALLVLVRVYPFEMAMTRVAGGLKILAVYPDVDGD